MVSHKTYKRPRDRYIYITQRAINYNKYYNSSSVLGNIHHLLELSFCILSYFKRLIFMPFTLVLFFTSNAERFLTESIILSNFFNLLFTIMVTFSFRFPSFAWLILERPVGPEWYLICWLDGMGFHLASQWTSNGMFYHQNGTISVAWS